MNLSSLKIFEISSASLPGGNQVDGIPPASSLEIALPDQVLVWFRAPVLDPFIKNENHPNSLVAVGVLVVSLGSSGATASVAGCGRLWPSVAVCGRLGLSVAVCGCLWPSVASCGRLWLVVPDCGRPWPSVDGCGQPWLAVAGCGRLWSAVAGCGRPWPSVAGYVFLIC